MMKWGLSNTASILEFLKSASRKKKIQITATKKRTTSSKESYLNTMRPSLILNTSFSWALKIPKGVPSWKQLILLTVTEC